MTSEPSSALRDDPRPDGEIAGDEVVRDDETGVSELADEAPGPAEQVGELEPDDSSTALDDVVDDAAIAADVGADDDESAASELADETLVSGRLDEQLADDGRTDLRAAEPADAAAVDVAAVDTKFAGTAAADDAGEGTLALEGLPEPESDEDEPVSALAGLGLDDPQALRRAVEAVLFVVDAPVSAEALATALQQPEAAVETALAAIRLELDERDAGLELREVAGGVRIYTRPQWAPAVEAFVLEGQRNRLSQASLETLAVVAYRQPVTRARISAIRGVTVDGVVRTLLARGLLVEAGTDADTGGSLLATTDLFLERMGLNSLDELPSLAPLLPDAASLSRLDEVDGIDVDDL